MQTSKQNSNIRLSLFVVGMFILGTVASARSAPSRQASEQAKAQAIHLLAAVENSTDLQTQEIMKQTAVGLSHQDQTDGRKTIFLTCAIGHGAIFVSYRIGICEDSARHFHTLMGMGGGLVAGIKASLVFGVVRTSTGSITGHYRNVSIGSVGRANYSGATLAETFSRSAISGSPYGGSTYGFGPDLLAGRGTESAAGNTVVLVGPAWGLMPDLSYQGFTID